MQKRTGSYFAARRGAYRAFLYILLIATCALMLLPFFWMVTTSLKTHLETMRVPIQWLPQAPQWKNYSDALAVAPFGRYFLNSAFIAVTTTVGEVLLTIFAAYAFAKMRFFGKNVLFATLLGTLMIPGEMLLIPNYVTMYRFGWLDKYQALIIPWLVSVFAIFLLRQFFRGLPDELWDSARIDGCSRLRYILRIIVPLSKPALVTIAVLKFLGSWNAFLWVLIMTTSQTMRTVPVGLSLFSTEMGTAYEQLMAASVVAIAPVLVLFFLAQKQFIQGIARSGIK